MWSRRTSTCWPSMAARFWRRHARRGDACRFEASCGGTIPIILALTKGLVANDISRVVGIVNGTCNYILTQMTQRGESYADALSQGAGGGISRRRIRLLT